MKRLITTILFLLFGSFYQWSYGQTIENFTLVNTVDDSKVSLNHFSNKKGIVVIFTSDFCPYSKLYEERIDDLVKEFSEKDIQFILINPNNPLASQDDSVEKMAKNAREKGYRFPYLADKDQKVANIFGATKTPEAFLLKPSKSSFKIVYSGAIDDNPQVASDTDQDYLKEAINNLLRGRPIQPNHQRPTGCMIRKR